MSHSFSHEKLLVYKRALEFVELVDEIILTQNGKSDAFDQLDRSSTSIPLNIAEGTGKYTGKDNCRFYDIAPGSAVESAACLDVLLKRNKITIEENKKGKEILFDVVSMLVGLIKSSSDRLYEPDSIYNV